MLFVRLSSLKERMAKSGVPQHLILKHIAPNCPKNAAAVKYLATALNHHPTSHSI